MTRLAPLPWTAQNDGPKIVEAQIDMRGGCDGADLFVEGFCVRRGIPAKDQGLTYQRAQWEANETAIVARRLLARALRNRRAA